MMNGFSNKKINIDELPDFRLVELNRISPRFLIKGIIQLSIFTLVLATGWIILALEWNREFHEALIGGVALLLVIFLLVNILKKQGKYGYAIRERDVVYHRGWIVEKTTVVPFVRMQHVSTSRSFLEKFLGLAKLKIFTAGGSGSDLSIPGLTPELAQKIKEKIANQIKDEHH